MKNPRRAGLISEFIDLMNEHGLESQEVKDFMRKYRGDKELRRLLKTVKNLKIMYDEGELD
ncbi:MAG: hypothetical protein U9P90_03360 [Patescibacteria group bacterium]|nr:hypothetical protein [Patescibacteria group bacterium]